MDKQKVLTNVAIADLLRSVAAAYTLEDKEKNKFKIIAYERAADAVEHLSSEAKDLWDEGKLEGVSGIGLSITGHLGEVFKNGRSKHFDELLAPIPPAVFELMKLSGVGPKTAYKLVTELKISNKNPFSQLKTLLKQGKVASLEGFGVDSQDAIMRDLQDYERKGKVRMLLPYALSRAEDVITWLKGEPSIVQADPLGSMRRRASTVGDIDIAVASKVPEKAIARFISYPRRSRVIEKGTSDASILIPGEIQVDLKVQPPQSYGSLLQHFTGSKHHNIALRDYALKKNLSLSEYGIKKIQKSKVKIQKYETEKAFYAALGMEYIEPELREDQGEIQAALRQAQGKPGGLPKLVELSDIKGDLQIHTNFDVETSHDLGTSSMDQILAKAADLGYEYVAFTDHNPSQKGHSADDIHKILKRRKEAIEAVNQKSNVKAFNSLEVDIMPDGSLPISPEALNLLDFVLVSIHSSFKMAKSEATKRVLSALAYPKVKIFAHPTARKINEREGVEMDWEAIFEYCVSHNIWIEINADPARLDLPDFLVKEAIKHGVLLTLGTDSHYVQSLDNMPYGVYVARRGWAQNHDIINSRSLKEFERLIGGE